MKKKKFTTTKSLASCWGGTFESDEARPFGTDRHGEASALADAGMLYAGGVTFAMEAPALVSSARTTTRTSGLFADIVGSGPDGFNVPKIATMLEHPSGTGRAFAGHGIQDATLWTTTVPDGTSIMIPGREGLKMPDALGGAIESGQWDLISANPEWCKMMEGSTTHLPGATIPNLGLLPPTPKMNVLSNSITVQEPTLLSQMLKPGMGHLDWAACRCAMDDL